MGLLDLFVTRGDAANELKGNAEIEIDAPADEVYWLVSDVIEMGQSLWRYELEATSGGTRVRKSFQVLWWTNPLVLLKFGGRESRLTQLQEGLWQSLEWFKVIAKTPLPAAATGIHAGYKPVS